MGLFSLQPFSLSCISSSSGSSTVLQKRIGQVLREQCKHLWLPPYCTKTKRAARTPFRTARLGIPDDKSKGLCQCDVAELTISAMVFNASVVRSCTKKARINDSKTPSVICLFLIQQNSDSDAVVFKSVFRFDLSSNRCLFCE